MAQTLAIDNFNRADGGLGSNWTTITGLVAPAIVSNVVNPSAVGGSGSGAFYNAITWPNDHFSQVKVGPLLSDSNHGILVCCRTQPAANSYYAFQLKGPLGATAVIQTKKYIAGVATILVTQSTVTAAIGDILRLEVSSSTISGYLNGVLLHQVTDTDLTSGSAGILIFAASGTTPNASLDDWSGGDLTNPGVGSPQVGRFIAQLP